MSTWQQTAREKCEIGAIPPLHKSNVVPFLGPQTFRGPFKHLKSFEGPFLTDALSTLGKFLSRAQILAVNNKSG